MTAVRQLTAVEVTPESFAPFGQIVQATEDMHLYGPKDAQLDLSQGTPRFYMIRVKGGELKFNRITHHKKVTQCLAAAGDKCWYMAVARPSVEPSPKEEDIVAFCIPPATILKLDRGTWHAGPLFADGDSMPFYNLELTDTNQTDHHTHFYKEEGVEFVIQDTQTE